MKSQPLSKVILRPSQRREHMPKSTQDGQEWSCALDLLAHQEKIRGLFRRGRWDKLRPLRDFSLPLELKREPVLLKLLRRELAQLFLSGVYARVLGALSIEAKDKVAAAKHRGLVIHVALVEAGSLSLEEAVPRLRFSGETVMDHVNGCNLMACRDWQGERWAIRFPKWQSSMNGPLPGIVTAMQALRCCDHWEVTLYFLAHYPSLGGKSPLDLLRTGEIGKVLRHPR